MPLRGGYRALPALSRVLPSPTRPRKPHTTRTLTRRALPFLLWTLPSLILTRRIVPSLTLTRKSLPSLTPTYRALPSLILTRKPPLTVL